LTQHKYQQQQQQQKHHLDTPRQQQKTHHQNSQQQQQQKYDEPHGEMPLQVPLSSPAATLVMNDDDDDDDDAGSIAYCDSALVSLAEQESIIGLPPDGSIPIIVDAIPLDDSYQHQHHSTNGGITATAATAAAAVVATAIPSTTAYSSLQNDIPNGMTRIEYGIQIINDDEGVFQQVGKAISKTFRLTEKMIPQPRKVEQYPIYFNR
jgi:hypothetical protein